MTKSWNVVVDDKTYYIELKGRKVIVNGEEKKLKELQAQKKMTYTAWKIQLGNMEAVLYGPGSLYGSGFRLVMNGVDCATREPYAPIEKVPAWSIVFIVFHCFNLLNGAIGICFAFLGIAATISLASNEKMNIGVKLLLSFVVLIASFLVIFGLAFMLQLM